MRQTCEIPLDIPDVTIENVTTNRIGHIEITVKSTVEGTPCHRCGKMTTQFYGVKTFAHSGQENLYSSSSKTLSVPPLSWQPDHHAATLLVYPKEFLYQSL